MIHNFEIIARTYKPQNRKRLQNSARMDKKRANNERKNANVFAIDKRLTGMFK